MCVCIYLCIMMSCYELHNFLDRLNILQIIYNEYINKII